MPRSLRPFELVHYVYLHLRASDGTVFYVGKGSNKRAWSAAGRRKWWKSIVAKHGFKVEIAQGGLDEKAAMLLEKRLISEYRLKGARLCNMTDGGEGASGNISVRRKMVFCSNGMTFPTTQHAAAWLRATGFIRASSKSVSAACTGKKQIVYGFCWSYKSKPDHIDVNGRLAKSRNSGSNRIKVFCSNGMSFGSATAAAIWAGKGANMAGKILECCRDKRKSAFGFTWGFSQETIKKYKDPIALSTQAKMKPVKASNGMIFESGKAAIDWAKSNGKKLSHSRLSIVTKNPNQKAAGLQWTRDF